MGARAFWILTAAVAAMVALSAIAPRDVLTWFLEVSPVLAGWPLLVATRRRFPLTPLAYGLAALHAGILALGGHYTYAEVPLGYWMQDAFGFARNHYDRIGHVAQGFIPAILAREIIVRTSPLGRGGWLTFLAGAVALAISALYELLEAAATLVSEEATEAFLGTQGDPLDTQWDMFLALAGAVAALLLLSRLHDRQLARLRPGD